MRLPPLRTADVALVAGSTLILAFAITAVADPPSAAPTPDEVVPGQRLRGILGPAEVIAVPVRATRGTELTLRARALRSGVEPRFTITDPDGLAVPISAFEKRTKNGSKTTVRRLPVATSGIYLLSISSDDGAGGAFELRTQATAPSKQKAHLTVANANDDVAVTFDAHAGDVARLKVRKAKGSSLATSIRTFTPAGGEALVLNEPKRSPALTVESFGVQRFDVTGQDGTTGAFTCVLTVRPLAPPRGVADIRDYARGGPDLTENLTVYDDVDSRVISVYVTIRPEDNPESDEDTDCGFVNPNDGIGTTLADVHQDEDGGDDCKPELNVIARIEGHTDPGDVANAELRIRGQTSRYSSQKSYRLKLKSKSDLWRGQRVLQLNKHPYDLTRFRNKLSFDLLSETPGITSLRTQFVRLFVDQQDGNGFVDFGLYTHVEKVDEHYLASHGLDPDGTIYKAEFFEFERYAGLLETETSPDYDATLFDTILEVEEGGGHEPLIDMLDALNAWDGDFASTFETHFNESNYLTWLACQVLMDNHDTNSQNFYLYRPAASRTFYFLPWDYDGAWDFYGQPREATDPGRSRWQYGISNWWGVRLHREFLKQPGAVEKLTARMRELKDTYLTAARIQARVDTYLATVRPIAFAEPDVDRLPLLDRSSAQAMEAEFDAEAERLGGIVETSFQQYLDNLDRPMPIYMAARVEGSDVAFTWDESYDLQGDPLTYDFEVSTSPRFEPENAVTESLGLTGTYELRVPLTTLPAGTYYYRVTIRDDQGHWQLPFDTYWDAGVKHFGTRRLDIE